MAFLILFLMLLVMRVYFMVRVRRAGNRILPDKDAVQREGGHAVFLVRIVVFLALLIFLGMYFLGMPWIDRFAFHMPAWLRWTGFIIGLLAVAFWMWVQTVLDVQWSAQLQLTREHNLITTGPYARIRHPLYTGMFGWCIALSLLTANWIFFAACLLSFLGVLWRIPREERMMIEAFGDEYRSYMRRTGRLFPKLSH